MFRKNGLPYVIALSSILLMSSCGFDEPKIEFDFPMALGLSWTYTVFDYDEDDTVRVGTILSQNLETGFFEGRGNALRQRREIRMDSLVGTPQEARLVSTFFVKSDGFHQLFAPSIYGLFDQTFSQRALDSLAKMEPGGLSYQRFNDFTVNWRPYLDFRSSAERGYEIMSKERFFINFRFRDDVIDGYCYISAVGRFDGVERVQTPIKSNILAYRNVVTMNFDFFISKNGQPIPEFRNQLKMTNWFHPTAGLIRRDREPYRLFIPTIPSRWGIVIDKGQIWELTAVSGITL